MSEMLGNALIWIALKIWRTDITFYQYPFGPPDHGFRYRFAWWAYHRGLSALSNAKQKAE